MTIRRKTKKTRIAEVIEEFKQLVLDRYPEAEFEVTRGDDPPGIHVWATVNTDDLWEVIEYVSPRVVDVQVDEGLPVYLFPTRSRPWRTWPAADAAEPVADAISDDTIDTDGQAATSTGLDQLAK
jgi:hypothetical protein